MSSKYTPTTFQNTITPVQVNAELAKVKAALEDTVSRTGGTGSGNQMEDVLSMNSNRIINVGTAVAATDAVNKAQMDTVIAAVTGVTGGTVTAADLAAVDSKAQNAQTSATNAAQLAATANGIATAAQTAAAAATTAIATQTAEVNTLKAVAAESRRVVARAVNNAGTGATNGRFYVTGNGNNISDLEQVVGLSNGDYVNITTDNLLPGVSLSGWTLILGTASGNYTYDLQDVQGQRLNQTDFAPWSTYRFLISTKATPSATGKLTLDSYYTRQDAAQNSAIGQATTKANAAEAAANTATAQVQTLATTVSANDTRSKDAESTANAAAAKNTTQDNRLAALEAAGGGSALKKNMPFSFQGALPAGGTVMATVVISQSLKVNSVALAARRAYSSANFTGGGTNTPVLKIERVEDTSGTTSVVRTVVFSNNRAVGMLSGLTEPTLNPGDRLVITSLGGVGIADLAFTLNVE